MRVAVAVSGGVDSLLSLLLLREQGHGVMAVHGRFLARDTASAGLARVCGDLGVPFHSLDLRRQFDELVQAPFADAYARGRTPNPCALCNVAVKFGLLMDMALALGADVFATGHYARREGHPVYGETLMRGADQAKDQSYFLAQVPWERLRRCLFPLGGLAKTQVRSELAARGLAAPLSRESREACFLEDGDYRDFLTARGVRLSGPGGVELADGTPVGRHLGLWRHTQGQRRGLGIAWAEPLYVLDKDMARNVLVVGPGRELEAWGCEAGEANFLVRPDLWPDRVLLRTRYRQKAKPSRWSLNAGALRFDFAEPHSRPTPGQLAVAYDEAGVVLGAGVIRAAASLASATNSPA